MLVQLLGSPAIIANGRRLEHPAKKAMALLAYLAMRAGEHISRSHLAALLWADSDEEQARANLRQTLSQLRKLFKDAGADPLLVPFDKVVLGAQDVSVDVKALLSGLETLGLAELSTVPVFLEGFVIQAPEFDNWLATQRSSIRARLVAQFERRAESAKSAGDNNLAVEALSLALTLDPLKETIHRALIEALAALGRSDEALKQYETCRTILKRELQIEPASSTQAIAARIRNSRRARPQPAQSAGPISQFPLARPMVLATTDPKQNQEILNFSNAAEALHHGLKILRGGGEFAGLRLVAALNGGDPAAAKDCVTAILAQVEPGTIRVSDAVFDLFRENSPFAFGERRQHPDGNASYRLLSEFERHRLLLQPTIIEPTVASVSEFSVAVLPLVNRCEGPDSDRLSDVIAEEIIHRLSRYRGLTVAAPSAVRAFRSMAHAPERARSMFGTNYLVDGTLVHDAGRLRIHINLTDLRVNQLIFSHKCDGQYPDAVFNQGELADQLATIIFHKTQSAEMLRAERAPTQNSSALDWFLRGLAAHRRAGILLDNAKEAFSHFSNAIDLDPRFARAIAWRLCAVSWFDPAYLFNPGMQQIQNALAIDEDDAEVHRIAGSLYMYRGDGAQAIRHLERATELNPSDAYLLATLAGFMALSGEPRKGLALIDRAMRLDPFLPTWCVEEHGVVLYTMSDFASAIASLQRLATPRPRSLAYLAASQAGAGQGEDARETVERLRFIAPNLTADHVLATEYYRDEKNKRQFRERLSSAGLI